jgi:hypothetical protein
MIRFHKSLLIAMVVVSLWFLAQFAVAVPMFPPPGVDIVNHNLRIDMDIGDDGIPEERLVFNGTMTIERGPAFINTNGFRQINFVVLHWEATTHSQVLDVDIDYISSPISQPISTITSEQIGSDFPAFFKFNVIFDVFANGNLVFMRHMGMPQGGGFMTVPPDANSPFITQFENVQIVLNDPQLGPIRFTPVDCQDTSSTTIPEPAPFYLLGVGLAAMVGCKRAIFLRRYYKRS